MNRGFAALVLGVVALFFARSSRAAIHPPVDAGAGDWTIDYTDGAGNVGDESMADVSPDARVDAFLWMIGSAETSPQAMASAHAYSIFYGNTFFTDFRDHPVITGEKRGVELPDEWCAKAGFSPGCVSTAAGFAQINLPTWREVRRAGIWGPELPDFSPESQWEAARRVLILSGALDYVKAGDFENALRYASRRWASLAGSTSGQPQKRVETLARYYSDALEAFA